MYYTDTSREIDRLSRDKLSMPPGMKGILCIKFDLFKIKNTDFWAAYDLIRLCRSKWEMKCELLDYWSVLDFDVTGLLDVDLPGECSRGERIRLAC